MLASMVGNYLMVRALIEHGADVNARSRWGQTPLHYAVSQGHTKTVQVLLNHGANINVLDTSGKRPIHQVGIENPSIVQKYLVKYDRNSSTIAQLLVKHGAQNTRDNRKKLATERFMPKNAKRILQAPTRIAARKELQTRSLPPELISTILQYANLSNAGPHTTRNESKNNERLVPSRKRKSKKNTPTRSTRRRS
jgi:ankyrin repeat protein